MSFFQLLKVLAETDLSPEQLAPYLGVGSMTLRRWKNESPGKKIPKLYQRSVIEGVYQLIIEGKLSSDSAAVQKLMSSSTSLSFQAALKTMGVVDVCSNPGANHQDQIAVTLSHIGLSDSRRAEVDASEEKIQSFKKLGHEWQDRITTLWEVVRSKNFASIDKLVAYGALFYLVFPLDLIPDHLPVVGLLDDFGILGMATTFYVRKFSAPR